MASKFKIIESPEPVAKALEEILPKLENLIPHWCQEVTLNFTPGDDDNCPCSCSVAYPYRHATIWIHAMFISANTVEERISLLRHEMMHIYLNRVVDFAQGLIKNNLGNDSPAGKSLKFELSAIHEATTEDLKIMLENINKGSI